MSNVSRLAPRCTVQHNAAVPAAVLAHASGFSWDEALFVLIPVVVLVALVALATRRVRSHATGDIDAPDLTGAESADVSPLDGAP